MSARSRIRAYFVRNRSSVEEARLRLWTDVTPATYAGENEKYQSAIMDQYKLYVEMADRVSARRSLTNAFFLTLNSAILAAFSPIFNDAGHGGRGLLAVAVAGLSVQCAAWYWILRSYRQLNSAKFRVIGAFEERLPASPYWRAEWASLGRGRDPARYWSLTQLEQWVPPVFACAYIVAFVVRLLR